MILSKHLNIPAIVNQMYNPKMLAYNSIGLLKILYIVKPQPRVLKNKESARNIIVDIHIPALINRLESEEKKNFLVYFRLF